MMTTFSKTAKGLAGVLGAAGVVALLGACGAGGIQPAPPTVETTLHVCSSCHGLDGKSINPTFPRLAGQQKDYLVVQLHNFKDTSRGDPYAHIYMWGMAARLPDPIIDGVADYFSALPPASGTPGDPKLMAVGSDIFHNGIEARQVPACITCHGEHAEGLGVFPRLAGQHPQYLALQLKAFAANTRANEIMHANALPLTDPEIAAVTAYLAAQ